jgi:3-hydroxybutyryl-CoA dehydratase
LIGTGSIDLRKGDIFPVLNKTVTQQNIRDYANISGDLNQLHLDEKFAQKTAFGGIVAHGMLTLAYVSEMMTAIFGKEWLSNGHLDVRFKHPARPGDELVLRGEVISIVTRKTRVTINCDIQCKNQNSQLILIGNCRVKLPRKE